jgi:hypothetical protein
VREYRYLYLRVYLLVGDQLPDSLNLGMRGYGLAQIRLGKPFTCNGSRKADN